MNSPAAEKASFRIVVPADCSRQRIDSYLADHPDLNLTRSRIQKLIDEAMVYVNGRDVTKRYRVQPDDEICITIPPSPPSEVEAEAIPLDIVYVDDHLAVVNKPAGLVTHPGAGNRRGTLVNALRHHLGKLAAGSQSDRPGIVHRLDKNTSGLLVVARSDEVYLKLQAQLQARSMKRTYLALVCGHVGDDSGTIDAPIGRALRNRKKMIVTDVHSREAVTHYQLVERFRTYDLLEVSLGTGRTHQIRVHMAHLGRPVFGDPEYGGRDRWHRGIFGPERPLARRLLSLMARQALHAWKLEFTHPVTSKEMQFEAELPSDFVSVLELLRREGV